MEREKLAQSMRGSIINNDMELIIETFDKVRNNVNLFYYNEIGLKGKYKELNYQSSMNQFILFKYKENSLDVRLFQEEHKIVIKKVVNPSHGHPKENVLDEIVAINGELKCSDGNFEIEEIDKYLSKTFAELIK
jgi:hypothetical protein